MISPIFLSFRITFSCLKEGTTVPDVVLTWGPSVIGLCMLFLTTEPIDQYVNDALNDTVRKLYDWLKQLDFIAWFLRALGLCVLSRVVYMICTTVIKQLVNLFNSQLVWNYSTSILILSDSIYSGLCIWIYIIQELHIIRGREGGYVKRSSVKRENNNKKSCR